MVKHLLGTKIVRAETKTIKDGYWETTALEITVHIFFLRLVKPCNGRFIVQNTPIIHFSFDMGSSTASLKGKFCASLLEYRGDW